MERLTVHYTKNFPAINYPIYCETRNNDGHIVYWNTFKTVDDMEKFIEKLFFGYRIVYTNMR